MQVPPRDEVRVPVLEKKKRRKALAAFEPTAQAMEETFSTCVDLILDMGEGLKDAEGVAFT